MAENKGAAKPPPDIYLIDSKTEPMITNSIFVLGTIKNLKDIPVKMKDEKILKEKLYRRIMMLEGMRSIHLHEHEAMVRDLLDIMFEENEIEISKLAERITRMLNPTKERLRAPGPRKIKALIYRLIAYDILEKHYTTVNNRKVSTVRISKTIGNIEILKLINTLVNDISSLLSQ